MPDSDAIIIFEATLGNYLLQISNSSKIDFNQKISLNNIFDLDIYKKRYFFYIPEIWIIVFRSRKTLC